MADRLNRIPSLHSSPPDFAASPADDPLHAPVQDYLDQVCAPLIGVLPYAARLELRQEIEQHLRALIEAYRELGETPEGAFAHAVEKFGRPEQVARQWKPQTIQRRPLSRPRQWLASQWQGMCAALLLTGLLGLSGLSPLKSAAPLLETTLPPAKTAAPLPTPRPQVAALPAGAGIRHADFSNTDCRNCHRSDAGADLLLQGLRQRQGTSESYIQREGAQRRFTR